MKISVDDKEILTLSETQKKVIKNDIPDEIFDADMCRRLCYILEHKYERWFERLKKEWEPRLKSNSVSMVPTDNDAFAELVFSQPDYKSRSVRDKESNSILI